MLINLPAIVPVTVLDNSNPNSTDVPFHPHYNGKILFRNTFDGQLPATDYPKVTVSTTMFACKKKYLGH